MKTLLVLATFLILSLSIFAQNESSNPRSKYPYAIKIGMTLNGDDFYFSSLSAEAGYFINHNIELQVHAGLSGDYSLGANFHLNNTSSTTIISPFAGAHIGVFQNDAGINLPVGINVIFPKGFSLSAAIASTLIINQGIESIPSFNINIGWNFLQ